MQEMRTCSSEDCTRNNTEKNSHNLTKTAHYVVGEISAIAEPHNLSHKLRTQICLNVLSILTVLACVCVQIVMISELPSGGTLREHMQEMAGPNMAAILPTLLEVAHALMHVHSAGVVHGNLTLEAIRAARATKYERGWHASITSFGYAQYQVRCHRH